jgi:hypothetical protein
MPNEWVRARRDGGRDGPGELREEQGRKSAASAHCARKVP